MIVIALAVTTVAGYLFFSGDQGLVLDKDTTIDSPNHTPKQVENSKTVSEVALLTDNMFQSEKSLEQAEKQVQKKEEEHELIVEDLDETSVAYAEVTAKGLVAEGGVFQQKNIFKTLGINNFNSYIDNLNSLASEEDLQKQYEVQDFLASVPAMQSYEHKISCGYKSCAMSIQDISKEDAENIIDNLLVDIPLGARFYRAVANDYGSSELRVIYQMEQTSTLIMNVL